MIDFKSPKDLAANRNEGDAVKLQNGDMFIWRNGEWDQCDKDGFTYTLPPEPENYVRDKFNAEQKVLRRRAFSIEFDPLVGMMARGEISMTQEQLVAVATEIRSRFPYQ